MVNRRDRKRYARRALKLGKKLDGLEGQVASLRQEISGARNASRPFQFWALGVGLPVLAIAICLSLIGAANDVPAADWLRNHLDLVGAVVVGISVVLQAMVTILDEWKVVGGKFRSAVSVLSIWTGFVGAALVVTAILVPAADSTHAG